VAVTRSVGITNQNRQQRSLPKTSHNRLRLQNCIADWTDPRDINILKIEVTVSIIGKKNLNTSQTIFQI